MTERFQAVKQTQLGDLGPQKPEIELLRDLL